MRLISQSVRRFSSRLAPIQPISAAEFEQRRQGLVKRCRNAAGNDKDASCVILLKGAGKSFSAPDVPHPFRQCSHFRYLTGVLEPNCYYLLHSNGNGGIKKILFLDRRSEQEVLWEGPQTSESELESTAKFDELLPVKELSKVLMKMASPKSVLMTEPDFLPADSAELIRSEFVTSRGIKTFIDELRLVKSEAECDMMRNIVQIGAQALNGVITNSKGLKNENVIVGLLEYEGRRRGAERLAYPPVVASGNRANTIHYLDANKSINPDDMILIDGGLELHGYVSDITCCFPVSGQFNSHQKALYEALLFVHQKLLEYANNLDKLTLNKLFYRMNELIAAAMREVGLISSKITDQNELISIANDLCAHHVSHYLGMDVHDCSSISRDITVPPNVVFTIEPGVYVPIGSKFPMEFQGIGYRIEDDVVTRKGGGIEVLSAGVPREVDAIEFLMEPSKKAFYYSQSQH